MMSRMKNTLDGIRAHDILPKKISVEFKMEQQNWYETSVEKEKAEKIMKRASLSCGTTYSWITYV